MILVEFSRFVFWDFCFSFFVLLKAIIKKKLQSSFGA